MVRTPSAPPVLQRDITATSTGQAILWLTTLAMLVVSLDVAVNDFGGRGLIPALQIVSAAVSLALGVVWIATVRRAPGPRPDAVVVDDGLTIDLRDSTGAMKPVAQAVVRHHALARS